MTMRGFLSRRSSTHGERGATTIVVVVLLVPVLLGAAALSFDLGKLQGITDAVVSNAASQSGLQRVSTSFRAGVPQYKIQVDRVKTQVVHVTLDQVFAALAGYFILADTAWSSTAIRLAVDAGTLAIVLVSLAIGMPFTLQYAREQVDAETAKLPGFLTANYIITAAWAGSMVLMAVANLAVIYLPSLPLWIGIGIGLAARNAAVYFTKWYPQYLRARGAPAATQATS